MLPLPLSHVAAMLGQHVDNQSPVISVACDSHKVYPGTLFFALKGKKQDGHSFLEQALEKGAVGAVVDSSYQGPSFGLPLIVSQNVLESLQQLARLAIQKNKPKVVAITGSLGKTTTKDFTTTLLKSRYSVYSDPGNANSKVGLPLSILGMRGDEELLVLEMGMSLPGEIGHLVSIAPPDVAVLTTAAFVHAMNFDSLQGIVRAKAEIFSHPKTAIGLYSADIPHSEEILTSGSCPKLSFSAVSDKAFFHAKKRGDKLFLYEEGALALTLPWTLLGAHNGHNFLAAVAAARQFGVTYEDIERASPSLKLPQNRLQLVSKGGILFIKDAYNANRNSICSAIETLSSLPQGKRKVAVLSEILELGTFAEQEHEAVARYALTRVDELFCIGEGAKLLKQLFDEAGKICHHFSDKEALRTALKENLREDDVVLLKGGRLYNLGELVESF